MPIFMSTAQMKNYMMKAFDKALKIDEPSVLHMFEDYINSFYDEFSPKWYKRTQMLANSCASSGIQHTGSGSYYEIDFHGHWETGSWSDETILLVNLTGSHGGVQSGTSIWGEGISFMEATELKYLKSLLIQAGLPLV